MDPNQVLITTLTAHFRSPSSTQQRTRGSLCIPQDIQEQAEEDLNLLNPTEPANVIFSAPEVGSFVMSLEERWDFLDATAFGIVVNILLHSSDCMFKDCALFKLMATLEYLPPGNGSRKYKDSIGKLVLPRLLAYFLDGSVVGISKRSAGLLLIELVEGSKENKERIGGGSTQSFAEIGKLFLNEKDKMLKIVSGKLIGKIVQDLPQDNIDSGSSLLMFFPGDGYGMGASFPVGSGSQWESSFIEYITKMEIEGPLGPYIAGAPISFNCLDVRIGNNGGLDYNLGAISCYITDMISIYIPPSKGVRSEWIDIKLVNVDRIEIMNNSEPDIETCDMVLYLCDFEGDEYLYLESMERGFQDAITLVCYADEARGNKLDMQKSRDALREKNRRTSMSAPTKKYIEITSSKKPTMSQQQRQDDILTAVESPTGNPKRSFSQISDGSDEEISLQTHNSIEGGKVLGDSGTTFKQHVNPLSPLRKDLVPPEFGDEGKLVKDSSVKIAPAVATFPLTEVLQSTGPIAPTSDVLLKKTAQCPPRPAEQNCTVGNKGNRVPELNDPPENISNDEPIETATKATRKFIASVKRTNPAPQGKNKPTSVKKVAKPLALPKGISTGAPGPKSVKEQEKPVDLLGNKDCGPPVIKRLKRAAAVVNPQSAPAEEDIFDIPEEEEVEVPQKSPKKRGRGRPLGSKGKPRDKAKVPIKKEISIRRSVRKRVPISNPHVVDSDSENQPCVEEVSAQPAKLKAHQNTKVNELTSISKLKTAAEEETATKNTTRKAKRKAETIPDSQREYSGKITEESASAPPASPRKRRSTRKVPEMKNLEIDKGKEREDNGELPGRPKRVGVSVKRKNPGAIKTPASGKTKDSRPLQIKGSTLALLDDNFPNSPSLHTPMAKSPTTGPKKPPLGKGNAASDKIGSKAIQQRLRAPGNGDKPENDADDIFMTEISDAYEIEDDGGSLLAATNERDESEISKSNQETKRVISDDTLISNPLGVFDFQEDEKRKESDEDSIIKGEYKKVDKVYSQQQKLKADTEDSEDSEDSMEEATTSICNTKKARSTKRLVSPKTPIRTPKKVSNRSALHTIDGKKPEPVITTEFSNPKKLINDSLARKPQVISWSSKGPKNQGRLLAMDRKNVQVDEFPKTDSSLLDIDGPLTPLPLLSQKNIPIIFAGEDEDRIVNRPVGNGRRKTEVDGFGSPMLSGALIEENKSMKYPKVIIIEDDDDEDLGMQDQGDSEETGLVIEKHKYGVKEPMVVEDEEEEGEDEVMVSSVEVAQEAEEALSVVDGEDKDDGKVEETKRILRKGKYKESESDSVSPNADDTEYYEDNIPQPNAHQKQRFQKTINGNVVNKISFNKKESPKKKEKLAQPKLLEYIKPHTDPLPPKGHALKQKSKSQLVSEKTLFPKNSDVNNQESRFLKWSRGSNRISKGNSSLDQSILPDDDTEKTLVNINSEIDINSGNYKEEIGLKCGVNLREMVIGVSSSSSDSEEEDENGSTSEEEEEEENEEEKEDETIWRGSLPEYHRETLGILDQISKSLLKYLMSGEELAVEVIKDFERKGNEIASQLGDAHKTEYKEFQRKFEAAQHNASLEIGKTKTAINGINSPGSLAEISRRMNMGYDRMAVLMKEMAT